MTRKITIFFSFKCVTLIMLLIMLFSENQAQQVRFNKIYDVGGPSAIYNAFFNIVSTPDSQYFFTGANHDLTYPYNSNFFYGLMNDTGKVLSIKKNHLDTVSNFYNEICCTYKNKFYTSFGAYNNQEALNDIYLFSINENLDTIWTKKIGLMKYHIAPRSIMINRQQNIVIVGEFYSCWMGCPVKDLFIEIDTLGNIIQLDSSVSAALYGIVESRNDNGYIATGMNYVSSEGQNYICKLDSTGHLVWSRSLGRFDAYSGSLNIENINDTTFLVSGFRRIAVGGGAIANLIVITESNQLKRDYFPSTPDVSLRFIQQIVKKDNYYYGYGKSPADSVVIFCMDTAFNFIWARYYLRDRSPNVLYDFRETSDGGFVASGFVVGPLNQDGWVLKLDSLGCDVSNCWIKDTSVDTATLIIPYDYLNKDIKIYPNPIHDQLRIAFEYFDASEVYTVSIQNMLGQSIYAQSLSQSLTELELSTLAPALYICEIRNQAGMRVTYVKLLKE